MGGRNGAVPSGAAGERCGKSRLSVCAAVDYGLAACDVDAQTVSNYKCRGTFMRTHKTISSFALAAAALAGATFLALPAQANTMWDVVGLGLDAVITVDGSNNITAVSGTVGNGGAFPGSVDNITGLLTPPGPIGGGTNADNDNVFIPGGSPTTAFLTNNGFAFGVQNQCSPSIPCTGGVLWADGGGVYELFFGDWVSDVSGSVSFTKVPPGTGGLTGTPLPATWTMLIAGFFGLGCLAYRGTKRSAAALEAA